MGKKSKKPRGVPFVSGDKRQNPGHAAKNDTAPLPRVREPKSIFDNVVAQLGTIPPGANLRPYDDSDPKFGPETLKNATSSNESENWLIDQGKLLAATNDALKDHNSSKRRKNHTPKLQKHDVRKLGFGIKLSFKCGYGNCKFESKMYELYNRTETGQPLPNLQVGVAMSKTDLTPKTVETLATTLNLNPPAMRTLYKSVDKALAHTEELSEVAMTDNRKEVTINLRLKGETNGIPDADVASDGNYELRSYHIPTGKSDSVSVPVIEQVTGRGLMVGHTNLSHRDGSLPADVHINAAESLANKINYVKAHTAPNFPLHLGTVNTDFDASVLKGLEAGRKEVGESRPLKRKGCTFHAESAAKRKFTRESLIKLTPIQKGHIEKDQSALPSDLTPNTCAACKKEFKSIKGLNIHRRSCKGERAEEMKIKGLEPLFLAWEKTSSGKITVKEKKAWRDGIRRWLMKRIKQELNLGIHAANPQNSKIEDDSFIHDALFLAGRTVVPCLSGNHDACLTDSRGCGGYEAPPDYDMLPTKSNIGQIPPQTVSWLNSVVDTMLSKEALRGLVVNGKKGTTSLVESVHKEIRIPIPKGRIYRKNARKLIKSGNEESCCDLK